MISLLYYFHTTFHNKILQMTMVTGYDLQLYLKYRNSIWLKKKKNRNKNAEKFKDFSKPNKEIKYYSRTFTKFKDFPRWLITFKTFSRLYEPWEWRLIIETACFSVHTFPGTAQLSWKLFKKRELKYCYSMLLFTKPFKP